MIYFTSDTHFGHQNIISYCGRPFSSVEEMDFELVNRWNKLVHPDDTVYHLGDFALTDKRGVVARLRQLSGHIVLIRGNHDRRETCGVLQKYGVPILDEATLMVEGALLRLRHEPRRDQETARAEIHLCGHVHEKWAFNTTYGLVINVGVDQWGFQPKTFLQLLTRYRASQPQTGDECGVWQ